MLGSFSSNDLSTSSKDTSFMFTSNLPSAPGRKGKDKDKARKESRGGRVYRMQERMRNKGKIIQKCGLSFSWAELFLASSTYFYASLIKVS